MARKPKVIMKLADGPLYKTAYAVLTPEVKWFNIPLTKDSVLAPTPGTLDANAASRYGRIGISCDCTISAAHLHYDHPAGTGSYDVEVYRLRPQPPAIAGPGWLDNPQVILIATVSDDGSGGDFHTSNFTFESEELKQLQDGDYLIMQVTSVMTGAESKEAACFVDIHFEELSVELTV